MSAARMFHIQNYVIKEMLHHHCEPNLLSNMPLRKIYKTSSDLNYLGNLATGT